MPKISRQKTYFHGSWRSKKSLQNNDARRESFALFASSLIRIDDDGFSNVRTPKSGIAYIRALRAKARHLVRNLALFILKQNFTRKKGVLLKFEQEKLALARVCRFYLPFPPESHKTFSLFSEAG